SAQFEPHSQISMESIRKASSIVGDLVKTYEFEHQPTETAMQGRNLQRPFGLGRVKTEITGCDRTTAEGRTISEKISLWGLNHSHLNAIMGSTFVARRAGIQQASNATNVNTTATTIKVSGSVGRTPNKRVSNQRVSA